jgi:hypothetical protein
MCQVQTFRWRRSSPLFGGCHRLQAGLRDHGCSGRRREECDERFGRVTFFGIRGDSGVTDAIQSNATYTYPMLGVTRQWTNYTALVKETGNARIWGGIHTRTADEHADMLGRQVAEHAFDNFLRPR